MLDNLFRRKKTADGKTVKDPICGMTVDIATALKSEQDGKTYYFCSSYCQKTFEAQPSK